MIKIEGKEKAVNFLIIDLPGREEIAPTFINKYVDLNINKTMYDIISNGYTTDKKINKEIITTPEIYMAELKLLLECFTLNPVAVPVFSVEIMENILIKYYSKIKEIIYNDEKMNITLTETLDKIPDGNSLNIKGNFNLLDEFISYTYDYRFLLTHDIESDITKLLSSNMKAQFIDPSKKSTILNNFIWPHEFFDSGLGWLTFNNYININDKGEIKIVSINRKDDGKDYKILETIKQWKTKLNDITKFTIEYKKENPDQSENLYSQKIDENLKKSGARPVEQFGIRQLYGLNIEQYNYCFYDTFFYFLSFIQKDIGENTYYKKFVIMIYEVGSREGAMSLEEI
jgi:hypothetical protein